MDSVIKALNNYVIAGPNPRYKDWLGSDWLEKDVHPILDEPDKEKDKLLSLDIIPGDANWVGTGNSRKLTGIILILTLRLRDDGIMTYVTKIIKAYEGERIHGADYDLRCIVPSYLDPLRSDDKIHQVRINVPFRNYESR